MKTKITKIAVFVLIAVFTITLGGCSGSADSLFEFSGKVLPKARVYAGKNAESVEKKAIAATTARDAMDNGTVSNIDELSAAMGL